MDLGDLMAFVLVLVRVATVFAFLPFLGERLIPGVVKALAAVVCSLALFPVLDVQVSPEDWGPVRFLLYVLAEGLLGALMGFSALLIFKALRNAGQMIAQQMGMALASIADPVTGVESTIIGTFCEVVGTLVFFGVNGHHLMLRALNQSFSAWPLGAFVSAESLRQLTVTGALHNFAMALQLAAPLLLLTFLVSLVLGVMARLVPEVNILIVGFPLRIGVGLIGLVLFVPVLVLYSGDVSRTMIRFMSGAWLGCVL